MTANNLLHYIFGASMAVHTLFTNALPGLAVGLLLLQVCMMWSNSSNLRRIIPLFNRLLAIQFSLAIMSGITLESDIHQNWSMAGDILSPLLNHPMGRSAFFGFLIISVLLALLLLYYDQLPASITLLCYSLIFIGTISLSWWSVVVNSWMHTPAGVAYSHDPIGRLAVTIVDLKGFIFNPSFFYRFIHIYISSIIEGLLMQTLILAFIIKKTNEINTGYLKECLAAILLLLTLQPIFGHLQAANLARLQPASLAGMEGYYHSQGAFHYYLIGWTDPQSQHTLGIRMPTSWENQIASGVQQIPGLDMIKKDEWPRIKASFYSFHFMILSWMIMYVLIMIVIASYIYGKMESSRVFYSLFAAFILSVLTPLAGWCASESARQPWLIYGILKTNAAAGSWPVSGQILTVMTNLVMPIGLAWAWFALQRRVLQEYLISHENKSPEQ